MDVWLHELLLIFVLEEFTTWAFTFTFFEILHFICDILDRSDFNPAHASDVIRFHRFNEILAQFDSYFNNRLK